MQYGFTGDDQRCIRGIATGDEGMVGGGGAKWPSLPTSISEQNKTQTFQYQTLEILLSRLFRNHMDQKYFTIFTKYATIFGQFTAAFHFF